MIFNMVANNSDWELISEYHLGQYSTDSTSLVTIPNSMPIHPKTNLMDGTYMPLIVFITLDENGIREGYYYGNIACFGLNSSIYDSWHPNSLYSPGYTLQGLANGKVKVYMQRAGTGGYGVFPYSISTTTGEVDIRARYSANNSGIVDGDFHIYEYLVKSPFNFLGE